MQRKTISVLVALSVSVALLISGCGGGNQAPSNQGSEQKQEGPIVLKLGHVLNEASPLHKGAEKFASLVQERSQGRLEVKIFPNGQLGNDRTLAEAMQMGTVDMEVCGTATVVGFVPRLQLFDLPFLFSSHEHAYKVLDGPVGAEVLKDFEQKGIVGLAYWENGLRHLTNSKRPVKTPEDVKGLKIRVQEIPLHVSFWKLLGADATPMAWSEVYTALQQKTVDGQENPIQTIYTQKIYEVQKYLSMTGHVYAPAALLISKKTWDKLPDDLKKVIADAAKETAPWQRNYVKDLEDKALNELPTFGMQIEANPDREAFKKAVQPVYDEYVTKLNAKALMDQILNTN